jgi:hypothetical protein
MNELLQLAVEDFVRQFGAVELSISLGSHYFSCEINNVPTIIYPVQTPLEKDIIIDLEQTVHLNKNSHKIIRVEVEIENNNIGLVRPVIISDLVSNKYHK